MTIYFCIDLILLNYSDFLQYSSIASLLLHVASFICNLHMLWTWYNVVIILYLILCFLKEIKWDESAAKGQILSDSIFMRMCANTLNP